MGLSLRQAAPKLGISHVYLGEIERGSRRLPEDRINRFAEVFGIDPTDLWRRHAMERLSDVEAAVDTWNEEHADSAGFFLSVHRMAG